MNSPKKRRSLRPLRADDVPFAVPLQRYEHPALRVLVNFGIVTGRDPSQQEVQQLAQAVARHVPNATIVVEQRYEVGTGIDILLREVRIDVPDQVVAEVEDRVARDELERLLVQEACAWVGRAISSRGDATSIAELRARQAVVDGRDGR